MSFRLDISKDVVAWGAYLDENSRDAGRHLDVKAQQTATVAAIFLAAAFGFIKPEMIVFSGQHKAVLGLFCATVITFVICLVLCLCASFLRRSPIPFALKARSQMTQDILRQGVEEPSAKVQENYYRDQVRVWQSVIAKRDEVNAKKASILHLAQCFLMVGMLMAVGLISLVIHSILVLLRSHA